MKHKFIIILVLCMFFITNPLYGAITFDVDGKWETTFDCADVSQPTAPNCDGITSWGGSWTFYSLVLVDGVSNNWTQSSGAENEWYYSAETLSSSSAKELIINNVRQTNGAITYTGVPGALIAGLAAWGDNDSIGHNTWYVYQTADPDTQASGYIYTHLSRSSYASGDYASMIASSANNSSGIGGKGFRTYDGEGVTMDTGPLTVAFPSPQKELWIRWYQRFEDGYSWYPLSQGPYPYSNKNIYLFTDTAGTAAIAGFHYREYMIGAQNTPDAYQVVTTGELGWPEVMSVDPETGGPSDGVYHCYEMHVKMDTDHTDGIGQLWIDGVLKVSNTSVDWSGSNNTAGEITTAQGGWTYFKLGENQGITETNGVVLYQDYDDIVVYNTTPPNLDADGNPYIGPIESSANPIVEILTISGQTTTAAVFQITGTATANTGLTIAGVTCPGQTVTPDDGVWDELSEAWSCQAAISVGVNNLTFTGTDSVASTGTDSIDVTRSPIKAAIRGTATIKNATVH